MNVATRKGKRKLGTKVLVYILALLMLFTQFANVTFAIEDNVGDVNEMQEIELPLENGSGDPEASESPDPSAIEDTTETPAPTESSPSNTNVVETPVLEETPTVQSSTQTPTPTEVEVTGTPIATNEVSPTATVDQIALATELVDLAESEMTPMALQIALACVQQLPDSDEKTELLERLDDILFFIYIIAGNLVDEADADQYQEDLDRALDYVKQLPEDTTKSMLLKRLAEIEVKINRQFNGNGLTAEYYDGADFSTLKAVKIIESVNGDLTLDEPVSTDSFGLRLLGKIKPRYTGTYTFYVTTDNESKLWIDGQLVYSGEGGGTGNIDLSAGESYEFKMECTGDEEASLFLEWSGAGQSREIVPKRNLFSHQFAEMKVVEAELQKTQISIDTAKIEVNALPKGTIKDDLLARIAVAQADVDKQFTGTGLLGMYYDNMDFSGLKAVQIDPTLEYDWDINEPHPVINGEQFSICWKGQVQPLYSGEYTFYTQSDDGVRVYINNQLVIDNWTDHPKTENSGKLTLEANKKYDIKVEFYENSVLSLVSLEWESSNQVREVIPKKCLYPSDYKGLVNEAIVKSETDKTISNLKVAEEMVQFIADPVLKASYLERTSAVRALILKPRGNVDGLKNDALLSGIYRVNGWFLDGAGVSKIEIVIDDNVVGEATYGSSRADVRSFYPDYENSNSGFYYDLNTASLPKGNHTLKVVETGKNGVKTSLKDIGFVTKLPAIGAIESPTGSYAIEGKFNVRGWFLDPSGVSKIEIYVNNVLYGEAAYGVLRYDVYNAHSTYNNYNAGFIYTLDTKSLKSRINTLKVIGYGNDGTVKVLPLKQFELKLSVKGWIDTPSELSAISGSTVVSGWVLDKNGVSKVDILVDGQLAGTAEYGLSRPDVIDVYPEYNNPNSGFKYTLNTQDISEGKHIISVIETDEYGISTFVCQKSVFISRAAAIGYIDTPVHMSSVNGNLRISGWVLDKNEVSNVYVYVDGIFDGKAAYGGLRKDVKLVYPSYDNENCGMSYILDTTKFAAGQHIIKIVELSNSGAINIVASRTIVVE